MTDAKVTIARELELIDGMIEVQLHHAEQCDHIANRTMAEKQKGWDMERVALLRKMRSALAAQPATVQPVEPVATSYADHQQRIGAPLTFFTSVAAQAYRAAATRDDVTHEDAMRVALQAVQGAAPPAPAAVPPDFEQHLIDTIEDLRTALHIVRQYPDFDYGGPLPQMIDDVLSGRRSAMLESLGAIRDAIRSAPED